MLADLVVKFSSNLTYSEYPSLSPEVSADMTSLSGLVVILGVVVGPSLGHARFEFILPLLMAAGVTVSGVAVSVSAWSSRAAPEQSGKVGYPAPLVIMGGGELRLLWVKEDLVGDLAKDRGGLSGLRNVSVHLGCETLGQ